MISFYSNLKKRFLRQIVSLYQQTNFEQYHGIYHVHTLYENCAFTTAYASV